MVKQERGDVGAHFHYLLEVASIQAFRSSRLRQREEPTKAGNDTDRQDPDGPPAVEPEKPNFGLSGLLAKETNTVKGVELKYNEPPEARKPLKNWRLYVFKGEEQIGE